MDRLDGAARSALQTLGVVVHSIRAVPLEDIAAAPRRGGDDAACRSTCTWRSSAGEIEESVAAYGRRPMAALLDALAIARQLHGRALHPHATPADMERFWPPGGTVCLCPLTEANLGDGMPTLDLVHGAGRH